MEKIATELEKVKMETDDRTLKRKRYRDSSSASSNSSRSRSRSREKHSSKRYKSSRRSRSRRRRSSRRSRSLSRSPSYHRRTRYYGTRENPYKSRVVGVFGLPTSIHEASLTDVFSSFGVIEHVSIIHDAKTGNSRGFGFVYFEQIDSATKARSACNGMVLEGRRIRVDYSITKRAHTPTPGVYMGPRETRLRRSRSKSSHRRRSGSRSSHRRRSRSRSSHRRRRSNYSRYSRSRSR